MDRAGETGRNFSWRGPSRRCRRCMMQPRTISAGSSNSGTIWRCRRSPQPSSPRRGLTFYRHGPASRFRKEQQWPRSWLKRLTAPLPQAAMQYEDEPIRRLVALCRELGAAGRPFYLSCRTAADLLGISHMQASRWLFLLAHDGVIVQLNKGDRAKRQAAEYRYNGD